MIYSDRILTRFDFVLLHLIIMQGQNHMNQGHYCPVKILDLEINRVDHHPLGR